MTATFDNLDLPPGYIVEDRPDGYYIYRHDPAHDPLDIGFNTHSLPVAIVNLITDDIPTLNADIEKAAWKAEAARWQGAYTGQLMLGLKEQVAAWKVEAERWKKSYAELRARLPQEDTPR